jgi:hypothetical protein
VTDPLTIPPGPDEFELSLFGPRYGECVVVHAGDGRWIVVDSCLERRTKKPVALWYLDLLGVPHGEVEMIVATHWHDDHVRGLGQLVEEAPNATLICSSALGFPEFLEVVLAFGDEDPLFTQTKRSGGILKMRRALAAIQQRGAQHVRQVLADMRLIHDTTGHHVEMWALSPSQVELQLAQKKLKQDFRAALAQLPTATVSAGSNPVTRLKPHRPNHTAVSLWLRIGDYVSVLGADLEETGNANLGWSAVVASTTRPMDRAVLVKVPHHGSATGHHQAFWPTLATAEVAGLLTPFVRGSVRLPKDSDISRLQGFCTRLYQTAPSSPASARHPKGAVRRTIDERTRSIASLHPPFGHVRVRGPLGTIGELSFQTFGSASSVA